MRIYLFILWVFAASVAQGQDEGSRTLIVIFDGLRPDYITPELMPHVFAFKEKGCYGRAHHSEYPTVTRVNAASYATGSYPHTHGLMGNTVYFPQVEKKRGLNTGDFKELARIQDATEGKLLTAISLGEILRQAGARFMVFSSGSSGQAYLQNHTVSGGVVNPEAILPESLKEAVLKNIGAPPPGAEPNTAQHQWATRALLQYGLASNGPLVSAIWFSDPDGTTHKEGIGSPLAVESLKAVDAEFGRIMTELEEKELADSFNIIITADHGFITDDGTESLNAFLFERGMKKGAGSDEMVLAGNAIYVKGHDPLLVREIVSGLQEQSWVGAIFTRAAKGSEDHGWVEGTLAFETIHWDHPTRAADILVDYSWDTGKNTFGYEGRSKATGVAGHGGSSPYEIHIPLIVSGPRFRKGFESMLPTSNVDIVPTILYLHHLKIPVEMEGRVMTELLADTPAGAIPKAKKETLRARARRDWGTYEVVIERSIVGKHQYIDYTRSSRKYKR